MVSFTYTVASGPVKGEKFMENLPNIRIFIVKVMLTNPSHCS